MPQQVRQVLVSLLPLAQSVELPLSSSLLSDTTFETAVPLAAILLDYLVAYVPYHSYPNTLSGVPQDIYECTLTIPSRDSNLDLNHSIIEFSSPASLREDFTQLKPENVTLKLAAIFADRLSAHIADGVTIHVKHNVKHMVHRVIFWNVNYKPSSHHHGIIQLLYINIYNLDILVWFVKFVRLHILDCMYYFKARQHTTEDRMLLVQPGGRICCDKKLRSIGCWTCICHADSIRSDDKSAQKREKRWKKRTGHASDHPKIHLQTPFPKLTYHQSHLPADLQFGS